MAGKLAEFSEIKIKFRTFVMISVQNTSTEHSAVAVGSVVHRQRIRQVINEGELRPVSLVVASHQHVDLVSIARPQVVGEVFAGEVCGSFRSQFVAISHFVEQNVFGDVLDELVGVAGIADGCNHQRVGDFEDLVLV